MEIFIRVNISIEICERVNISIETCGRVNISIEICGRVHIFIETCGRANISDWVPPMTSDFFMRKYTAFLFGLDDSVFMFKVPTLTAKRVRIELIDPKDEIVGQISFDFDINLVTFFNCHKSGHDGKVPLELSNLSNEEETIWMVRRDGDRFTFSYDGNIAAKVTCPNNFGTGISAKINKMRITKDSEALFVNLPGMRHVHIFAKCLNCLPISPQK